MNFNFFPVIILTLVFFLNFLSRTIFSPLMLQIEEYLKIDHEMAGNLFLAIALGYFLSLANSDKVSHKFGHRKTILISLLGNIVFLILSAFSNDYKYFFISFLLLGMATGLYLPSGIATITTITPQKNWGKALAIHEFAPNLAFILSPIIVQSTFKILYWKHLLYIISFAGILIFITYQLNIKIFDIKEKNISCHIRKLDFAKKPVMWLWVIIFGFGITGTMGIYLMLPLYLVSALNYDQDFANNLVGLSRIISIPMAVISGWLSDKFGDYNVLMIVMLITGFVSTLIGILNPSHIPYILFIQAASSVCFFPPAFSSLSQSVSSQCRSAVVSFTLPIAFLIGGGLIPSFLGFMGKNYTFQWGFIIVGMMICLGFFLVNRARKYDLSKDVSY